MVQAVLAATACALAATVGGFAVHQAVARRAAYRPVWDRWQNRAVALPPAAPPADQPTTATYRSRNAAEYWESPTHDFWATGRPNGGNWQWRRNRSA